MASVNPIVLNLAHIFVQTLEFYICNMPFNFHFSFAISHGYMPILVVDKTSHSFPLNILSNIETSAAFLYSQIDLCIIMNFTDAVLSLQSRKKLIRSKNQFSYSELLTITKKFGTILGRGGFGDVYLGTLQDDTQVAVKILSQSARQGYREFQSEVRYETQVPVITIKH